MSRRRDAAILAWLAVEPAALIADRNDEGESFDFGTTSDDVEDRGFEAIEAVFDDLCLIAAPR